MHISRQTISKWESDLRLPDMKMMLSISQFYNVSITELLGVDEKEDTQKSIEHIYDQTKVVLDKLTKETRKRRMRDWIIMGTCILSFLIMCVFLGLIYFKPEIKHTQYIVNNPSIPETIIDIDNSSFRIEKYDLSHLLIYVDCRCVLKEYTHQTQVKFGFVDENNQEHIYEAKCDERENFVYKDKIPFTNYQNIKVYIDDGKTKKVEYLYQGDMYLSNFLQNYVSVYLPRDSQWKLLADHIEFDIKSYYLEEDKEYEGKMVGELHIKVTSMENNNNEVLLDQKIPLSEKKSLQLSRKIRNKEEVLFEIEAIIHGRTYSLDSVLKEIRYGSSMGYIIY